MVLRHRGLAKARGNLGGDGKGSGPCGGGDYIIARIYQSS